MLGHEEDRLEQPRDGHGPLLRRQVPAEWGGEWLPDGQPRRLRQGLEQLQLMVELSRIDRGGELPGIKHGRAGADLLEQQALPLDAGPGPGVLDGLQRRADLRLDNAVAVYVLHRRGR